MLEQKIFDMLHRWGSVPSEDGERGLSTDDRRRWRQFSA
jgi:hypothetical protein